MALAVSGVNLFTGTMGGVFRSTDEGASWTAANSGLPGNPVNALAVKGTSLFAGTDNGPFRSTDNGASWTAVSAGLSATDVQAFGVCGVYLFVASVNGISRSSDDGATWVPVNAGLTDKYGLSFAVSGSNVFVGTASKLFLSTNYGTTWTAADAGFTSTWIRSLLVAGPPLFAGTGHDGVWRRPLSEMITPVFPAESRIPRMFALDQNYPNPFNPSTIIHYGLPNHSHVTLTVFNTLGQQVAQLVDGEIDAGYHEVKFDGSGLSSGVYLYRMQAGGHMETKRLLLIR